MNAESAKAIPNKKSFEEQVFARFDTIDARLEKLTDVRRELIHDMKHKLDLALKFPVEGRKDIPDTEDKIKQVENKAVS
jgi:predicted RND superfamily exporter protein